MKDLVQRSLSNKSCYELRNETFVLSRALIWVLLSSMFQAHVSLMTLDIYWFITLCFSDRASWFNIWINYQLAQIFFIYIIYHYMFRAIMLIFRRSHYCILAAYCIITTTAPKQWWYHMLKVYNNVTYWRWALLLETCNGILYK